MYNTIKIQSKINNCNTQIKFIESLGKMSHLANGKLKINYQRAIDDYQKQIDNLKSGAC